MNKLLLNTLFAAAAAFALPLAAARAMPGPGREAQAA